MRSSTLCKAKQTGCWLLALGTSVFPKMSNYSHEPAAVSEKKKRVESPCSFLYPSVFPLLTHPRSFNVLYIWNNLTKVPSTQSLCVPICCLSITVSAPHSFSSTLRSPIYLFGSEHTQWPSLPSVCLCNLIFPLPLLEQFDLNAELQLSQSQSSCGPPIRSRPFAFSSLDKE